MKFCLRDKAGLSLLTNLPSNCLSCVNDCKNESVKITCPADGKTRRNGIRFFKENKIYICSSSSDDIVSSKTFKKKFEPYVQLVQNFNSFRDQLVGPVASSSNRLVHNLVDLNAQNLQELDYFFSQVYEIKKYKDQLEHVKKIISNKENQQELAESLLNILKREKLVKFEIATHNKIVSPTSKFDKNKSKHNLHKVFLNSFSLFSKTFEDFGVQVILQQMNVEAFFDYQSMTVALTHFLNNALKYSAENSELRISFNDDSTTSSIIFDMVSLKISDEDMLNIFNEGYSGEEARRASLNGQGIGMWMANFIVVKNKGKIVIRRDVNKTIKRNNKGLLFENNIFEIILPK